jgi:hypothetical protein
MPMRDPNKPEKAYLKLISPIVYFLSPFSSRFPPFPFPPSFLFWSRLSAVYLHVEKVRNEHFRGHRGLVNGLRTLVVVVLPIVPLF